MLLSSLFVWNMCEMKREIAKASTKDSADLPRRWKGDKTGCFVLPGDTSAALMKKQSHCYRSCFLAAGPSAPISATYTARLVRREAGKSLQSFCSPCNPLTLPKGLISQSAQSSCAAVVHSRRAACSLMMLAAAFTLTGPKELTLCQRDKLNVEVWPHRGSASYSEQVTDSPSNFAD